jgi:hypothetical protein
MSISWQDGVVQLSCTLSMIGSALVMLTWAYPKKNQNKHGRVLLLWLSISDFCASAVYFVQTFHIGGNGLCTASALLGIFFPVASFLWTDCIAYYLYLVVSTRGSMLPINWVKLLRNFHIFVWSLSALTIIFVFAFGHAGYATDDDDERESSANNTGGWCWISADSPSERFMWEVIGGKFIEWMSCLFVLPFLYSRVYLELTSIYGDTEPNLERATFDTMGSNSGNSGQLRANLHMDNMAGTRMYSPPSPLSGVGAATAGASGYKLESQQPHHAPPISSTSNNNNSKPAAAAAGATPSTYHVTSSGTGTGTGTGAGIGTTVHPAAIAYRGVHNSSSTSSNLDIAGRGPTANPLLASSAMSGTASSVSPRSPDKVGADDRTVTPLSPISVDPNASQLPKVRSIESLFDLSNMSGNVFMDPYSRTNSQATADNSVPLLGNEHRIGGTGTGTGTGGMGHRVESDNNFATEYETGKGAVECDDASDYAPSAGTAAERAGLLGGGPPHASVDSLQFGGSKKRSGIFSKFYIKLAAVPVMLFFIRMWSSIRIIIQYARPNSNYGDSFFAGMQAFFDPSQGIFNAILFVFLSPDDRRNMLQLLNKVWQYVYGLCCVIETNNDSIDSGSNNSSSIVTSVPWNDQASPTGRWEQPTSSAGAAQYKTPAISIPSGTSGRDAGAAGAGARSGSKTSPTSSTATPPAAAGVGGGLLVGFKSSSGSFATGAGGVGGANRASFAGSGPSSASATPPTGGGMLVSFKSSSGSFATGAGGVGGVTSGTGDTHYHYQQQPQPQQYRTMAFSPPPPLATSHRTAPPPQPSSAVSVPVPVLTAASASTASGAAGGDRTVSTSSSDGGGLPPRDTGGAGAGMSPKASVSVSVSAGAGAWAGARPKADSTSTSTAGHLSLLEANELMDYECDSNSRMSEFSFDQEGCCTTSSALPLPPANPSSS